MFNYRQQAEEIHLCLLCYALILGMLYLPHISAVGITESAEVAEERKRYVF